MQADTVQQCARDLVDDLPGSGLEHPFGPGADRDRQGGAGGRRGERPWITLHPGMGLREQLVEELVTESYLLVVQSLPRAKRPVDPASFGKRDQ